MFSDAPLIAGVVIDLLPWEAAHARAARTEAILTDSERLSLLHGTDVPQETPGHYVGNTKPIRRLGIPALKMQDASSGFRPTGPNESGTTTCWPSLLTLASTWDEALVARVAGAIGREFRGKGANVLLGPGVNVHRVARGGRNFEYLSGDDPYLGARLTAPYVRGLQREGVMAVVKHFAFNEQETDRQSENSVVASRTAWELYYPPFEAAILAGAAGVMCSYNKVNGTYACENSGILKRDLKERMGFAGFVVSDWGATHSAGSVTKGLDMEMPGSNFLNAEQLANISREDVRGAVRRVLAAMYHLRLDEQPSCVPPCTTERSSNQRTSKHVALAREAAEAGVVLLKNNGILPLDVRRVRKIAVIGPAATARDTDNAWGYGSPYAGGGSGHVVAPSAVAPLTAIAERAELEGISISAGNSSADIAAQVEAADVVVIIGSTSTLEGVDRASLSLDDGADALIATVAQRRPTIVLLEAPGAVLTPWRNSVAALACLFLGGEETGRAWAAMLFGDVTPAGKLPIALPADENETLAPQSPEVLYSEGISTSYRSPGTKAAFAFGHGLSYTRFSFTQPMQWTDGCLATSCVQVVVTNTGDRPGIEVAQAYLQLDPSVEEPRLLLRGFRRTRTLLPGEREEVSFHFTRRDLSYYWAEGRWAQATNVLVHFGSSSADIRAAIPLEIHTAAAARAVADRNV